MEEWILTGAKKWIPDETSQYEATQEAEKMYLSRGTGVRLQFLQNAEPIYLVGETSASKVTTTISEATTPGIAAGRSITFVAPPTPGAFDLNDLVFAEGSTINSLDRIRVPFIGASRDYEYKDGKWGYTITTYVNGRPNREFVTNDSIVPAGMGFQYLNAGVEKTIVW